jgi:hypothetical protein
MTQSNSDKTYSTQLFEYIKSKHPSIFTYMGGEQYFAVWDLDYDPTEGLHISQHNENGGSWQAPTEIYDPKLGELIERAKLESGFDKSYKELQRNKECSR